MNFSDPPAFPPVPVSAGRIVSLSVLTATLVLSVLGNCRLIVFLRNAWRRAGRTVPLNFFLINLAIGDICVGCFVCSSELMTEALGQWQLGTFVCKATMYLQFVCLSSTAFLLLAMSVDRYEVIVQPLKSSRRNFRTICRISTCWLLALAFAVPQALIFTVVEEPLAEQPTAGSSNGSSNAADGILRCTSAAYTAAWQRKLYVTYVLVLVVLVPTLGMVYCYCRIVHVIWSRTRLMQAPSRPSRSCRRSPSPSSWQRDSQQQQESSHHSLCSHADASQMKQRVGMATNNSSSRLLSRAKIKAVFMSLSVVVAFLVCWTPYFLCLLLTIYSDGGIRPPKFVTSAAEKLVLLHSVLNPMLYFMFATRASAINRVCHCCARCCKYCCCCYGNEATLYAPYNEQQQQQQQQRQQQQQQQQRMQNGWTWANYDMRQAGAARRPRQRPVQLVQFKGV